MSIEAVVAGIAGSLLPVMLAGQSGTSGALDARQSRRCTPVPAERGATIAFGRVGGNIRPRSFAIYADGRITVASVDATRDSVAVISVAAVEALARLARSGGFWELVPPIVRRPPRNPDAAREFVEVTLTCGRKRAEYVAGAEPAAFSEYLALLAALARSP